MSKKTSIEMRASLRTDLKDSATVWSDTELDRCVERAVSDLSRFLPRELVYEETIDYTITDESFTTPADADPDYFVVSVTIYGESAGATFAIAHYTITNAGPVALVLTDDNFSVTAFTFIVKGTDADGNYIEDSFHLSGGKSQVGKKDFKTVVQVELDNVGGSTISAADTFTVGTTNPYDVWVQLANKPIEPGSEVVTTTDDVTTYARDTDYRMDYANGRIKYMDDGDMEADTEYYVDYSKSRIELDLSSIIPDLITIGDVIYPAFNVPQQTISVRKWGNVITIEGSGIDSQERMTDDYHIAVKYNARHTPPSTSAPGSYPEFLEDTVILAASAYALFIEALQYEHQAVTDYASARTVMGDTLFTSMTTALTAAATELGYVTVDNAGTALVDMDTALVNTKKYLDNNSDADMAGVLADVVSDAAFFKDAINNALDAANACLGDVDLSDVTTQLEAGVAALDKVPVYLATNTNNNAVTILEGIYTQAADLRTAIEVAVDEALTFLTHSSDPAAPSAQYYLETGDDTIPTINTGANVPENYLAYAQGAIATFNGLLAEANTRLSNLRSYIEQSEGWNRIAAGFVNEAVQRVASAATYMNEELAKTQQAGGYVAEASTRIANLRTYIERAQSYGRIADSFTAEADRRAAESAGWLAIADRYIANADRYLAQAAGYFTEIQGRIALTVQYESVGNSNLTLADRYRAEAIERRNEAWSVWRDSKSFIGDFSLSALRQPEYYGGGRRVSETRL